MCDSFRTLQLNAVAECLSYGGFGGELFLGIRGDLYKMNCAEFLPHSYQQTVTIWLVLWLIDIWRIPVTAVAKSFFKTI